MTPGASQILVVHSDDDSQGDSADFSLPTSPDFRPDGSESGGRQLFPSSSLDQGSFTLRQRSNYRPQTPPVKQPHPLTRGDVTVDFANTPSSSRPGSSSMSSRFNQTQSSSGRGGGGSGGGRPRTSELFSRSQRLGAVNAAAGPRPSTPTTSSSSHMQQQMTQRRPGTSPASVAGSGCGGSSGTRKPVTPNMGSSNSNSYHLGMASTSTLSQMPGTAFRRDVCPSGVNSLTDPHQVRLTPIGKVSDRNKALQPPDCLYLSELC